MNDRQDRMSEIGQKMTSKWFSIVPKWLRYIIIIGGLILLGYLTGKEL